MHSSPRAPSVVLRTCKLSPAGRPSVEREERALDCVPFRLLSTLALRQAVLRASSRLAPSRSTRPCDLPVRKTRDASNRLLPPEPRRLPVRRTFSTLASDFRRPGRPATVRGCHVAWSRERAFSRRPNRFSPKHLRTRSPRAFVLAASGHERGPVRPAALAGMRPLTPLSRIPLSPRAHVTFVRALEFSAHVLMCSDECEEVGRVRNPPRPPSPLAREDQRLRMIRGAFYRQGPFVGSGGHYSPGPATTAPLLAMLRPLDDALTSPRALSRSRAVVVRLDPSRDSPFRSTRSPTCNRRRSPRPRPPFTRP
jgi:hypothetical protein